MIIQVDRDTPLIGCIAFGIIDRGTNLLQIRATTVCNINCTFCSVDGGNKSTWHKDFFVVDLDYLIEETKKVVDFKGVDIEINIDSVGEPFCYPKLEELAQKLRAIERVTKISIQTNGTIDKEIDVDVLNLSLHAMDPVLAKSLADSPCYNIEMLKSLAQKYKKNGITVRLCPVWLPGINDEELPKIIQFAKDNEYELGIQKYEGYNYSRKIKGIKPLNWFKFYRQIGIWEKEFDISLKLKAKDLNIVRTKRLPEMFKKGEKVQLEVVHKGWTKGQMIAKGRGRAVSVVDCERNKGDKINVTILEANNNIYVAK
jgi:uncharacterized protein